MDLPLICRFVCCGTILQENLTWTTSCWSSHRRGSSSTLRFALLGHSSNWKNTSWHFWPHLQPSSRQPYRRCSFWMLRAGKFLTTNPDPFQWKTNLMLIYCLDLPLMLSKLRRSQVEKSWPSCWCATSPCGQFIRLRPTGLTLTQSRWGFFFDPEDHWKSSHSTF